MSEANKTLESAAAAVTGAGTPDQATVHRPASGAVVALSVALAVACAIGAVVIAVLALMHWPVAVAPLRIHFLGWMGLLSIGCIPVVVIAFATPWIGRISASAGAASITVDARGPTSDQP